jgi:hypothetical protein
MVIGLCRVQWFSYPSLFLVTNFFEFAVVLYDGAGQHQDIEAAGLHQKFVE